MSAIISDQFRILNAETFVKKFHGHWNNVECLLHIYWTAKFY